MENDRIKILVPTAGAPPEMNSAEYIVRIASRLQADIVVLHIYEGSHPSPEASAAFDILVEVVAAKGLKVTSRIQRGDIVNTIVDVAQTGNFALVVMGVSSGKIVDKWISSHILHSSDLPVVVIPHSLNIKGRSK
ncbi:MAG: universal stress protein [candidate division Zixibacteria bacterium]|nr:universal stress protein [candidate division Zixibacteria bacterium]